MLIHVHKLQRHTRVLHIRDLLADTVTKHERLSGCDPTLLRTERRTSTLYHALHVCTLLTRRNVIPTAAPSAYHVFAHTTLLHCVTRRSHCATGRVMCAPLAHARALVPSCTRKHATPCPFGRFESHLNRTRQKMSSVEPTMTDASTPRPLHVCLMSRLL